MTSKPVKILKIYGWISLLISIILAFATLFLVSQNETGFFINLSIILLILYLLIAGGLFYQDLYIGYILSNIFGIIWILYLGVYFFINPLALINHIFPTVYLFSLMVVVNKYRTYFKKGMLFQKAIKQNKFIILAGFLILLFCSTIILLKMKNNAFYLYKIRYRKVLDTTVYNDFPILNLEQSLDDAGMHCYSAEMEILKAHRTPIVQWNGDTIVHQINIFDSTFNATHLLSEYDTTMLSIENEVIYLKASGISTIKINYPQLVNNYMLKIYEKNGKMLLTEFKDDHLSIINWPEMYNE